MKAPRLEIKEGTDQYSLFRGLTVLMLFIICFGVIWNVHEVKINRENGYHGRAVSCATLQGAIAGLAAENKSNTGFVQVYKNNCEIAQVVGAKS